MRLIAVVFLLLLAVIQYPLWLGKGGWLRVWELERQLTQAQGRNDKLKERNSKLESEVMDLKTGTDSVEERARFELGMIRKDEIFVQVLDPNSTLPAPTTPAAPAVSAKAATPVKTPATTPAKKNR
ncbi:cell division protein FtsB [Undibacterium crateris]|uniref:cell division protein FtsB n=1 Tax=Undibacterium crateris TaxID=2528175 RepID=UPI00138A31AA|nr:cell division protein FtsB [Undibacterium crateris]NDI84130.1 cell division protein FtsB [Undibacterium crateris]